MIIISSQGSVEEQHTLGGSAYRQGSASKTRERAEMAVTSNFHRQARTNGHFAPVASEELLANQRPTIVAEPRPMRRLPLVKATGRPIVQADIDDALDE